MSDEEAKRARIAQLEEQISTANDFYWNKQDQGPIIDDFTYDKLVEELKKLDPDHPLVTKIAEKTNAGVKVKHVKPMLSLDKVYSWEDLVKWCTKVARSENEMFCFSPKYDGLSLEIVNGRLITRGDGEVGNDITHLAPWIDVRVSFNGTDAMMSSVIRSEHWMKTRHVGELLVPFPRFEKLIS